MGGLISRWRKKPSTVEILEKLDKDIESLEKLRKSNLDSQKRIIGRLLLFSVLLYIGTALVFYFYYFPERWEDRLLFLAPFFAFGFLVWFLKRFLHWYFVKRIGKNEAALQECKDMKKEMLEEVMEKETYKKAKEILERFDPEQFKKLSVTESTPAPQRVPQGQDLRQRTAGRGGMSPQTMPRPQPGSMFKSTPGPPGSVARNLQTPMGPGMMRGMGPPGPPMPRPILPRERSVTDKLIDALVGDGISSRYALICKECSSHNGMAMKEEFEYLSFRCCYCYTMNPARKHKPHAPKLDFTPSMPRKAVDNVKPGEEKESSDEVLAEVLPDEDNEDAVKEECKSATENQPPTDEEKKEQ